MMLKETVMLNWISDQYPEMVHRISRWAAIPTGVDHPQGIVAMQDELAGLLKQHGAAVEHQALSPWRWINDDGELVSQSLPPMLIGRLRRKAPLQVLLVIHLDTVFRQGEGFDEVWKEGSRLRGPGVIDAKGGLATLLTVVEAWERFGSPLLGWTVALNPDEEIGSPGSSEPLMALAKQADVGLVFEPSLPDGSLVRYRKGSGNFTIVCRGVSAHAGRDFAAGRNALLACCGLMDELSRLTDSSRGISVNVGCMQGGGAVNVVPDRAVSRVNVRIEHAHDAEPMERAIREAARQHASATGCEIEVHGSITALPRPLTETTARLMSLCKQSARQLGMELDDVPTGGVCDGNKLAAAGLPVLDSVGPVGGGLHTHGEYLELSSLVPWSQMVALLLQALAEQGPQALSQPHAMENSPC